MCISYRSDQEGRMEIMTLDLRFKFFIRAYGKFIVDRLGGGIDFFVSRAVTYPCTIQRFADDLIPSLFNFHLFTIIDPNDSHLANILKK